MNRAIYTLLIGAFWSLMRYRAQGGQPIRAPGQIDHEAIRATVATAVRTTEKSPSTGI
jgi:hypothetical protein